MSAELFELGFSIDTRPIEKGENRLDRFASAGEKAESSTKSLSGAVGVLSGAVAALAGSMAIAETIRYADSWTQVDNQLRGVIDSEVELAEKQRILIGLANDTRSELGSTVELYSELRRATKDLGTTDETVIGVTKTLNNLFLAGGKSADEQAGAIRQLAQALGAGALRGDEFNSVAEGAPRILDALAQNLKISRGELREFAATGGITAEILIDALSDFESQAQDMADRTNATFAQFSQIAENNFTAFIGQSSAVQAATNALGESLVSLSENVGGIQNAAIAATTAIGAYSTIVGVKSVAAVVAKNAATVNLIKQEAALTATTLANTQAEVANLAVQKQALASSIKRIKSEQIRDTIRKQLTATTTALTAAETRLAAAETAAAAAGTKATTSAIALTGATRALGVATNFLLGPWGLLIAAIGAAGAAYAFSEPDAVKMNDALGDQIKLTSEAAKNLSALSETQRASIALQAQFELNDLKKEQFELEQQMLANSFNANQEIGLSLKENQRVQKVKERILELEKLIKSVTTSTGGTGYADSTSDQIEALKILQKEAGLASDELFIFRQVQKSIANKDAPEVTAEVRKQAEEVVRLRNEFKAAKTSRDEEAASVKRARDEYQSWLEKVDESVNKIEKLKDEIVSTRVAMAMGDLDASTATRYIDTLEDKIKDLQDEVDTISFDDIATSAIDGLSAIQTLAEDGSKEYMRLEQAIMAVVAAQAIAKAATDATTGNIIGAVSSGIALLSTFQDDLEFDLAAVQREQNVTVFGDKANSISVATDITANATEKLVGINTDMLNAMKVLNNSITGAASQVSRGVMGSEFDNIDLGIIENPLALLTPGLNEALNIVTLGLFKGVGKLLGGKSKVVDQGINIIGGAFDDLLENVTVEAFQRIKYKKHFLSSSKTKTQTQDLGDEVGNQISLVFQSIADSVTAGAESLGLSQSEINAAIRAFNIETEQISLKDLSAEEQKAEIEAYFSQIFSDLAGAVIPFIDEFQIAGEEMGETLARVATQVAVMDTLVEQLGVTMFDKAANPEVYARASDNIAMLVGGVEEFANKTGGFVNNFATDAQKIDIHRQSLESALGAVNLQLPITAEGMWQLMKSLDATTEAGQEQIAALLNVQDTASAYFDLLERESDAQKQAADAAAASAKSYRDMIAAMFDVQDAVARVSLDAALAAARMGDFSLAEGLNLSGLSPQASDFGSFAEFQFAQAVTANKLEELASLTENSVPVEERQLSVLEQIRDKISGEESNSKNIVVPDSIINNTRMFNDNRVSNNSESTSSKFIDSRSYGYTRDNSIGDSLTIDDRVKNNVVDIRSRSIVGDTVTHGDTVDSRSIVESIVGDTVTHGDTVDSSRSLIIGDTIKSIRNEAKTSTSDDNSDIVKGIKDLEGKFEHLSRNLGRMQSEANENLDKIANGEISVRFAE